MASGSSLAGHIGIYTRHGYAAVPTGFQMNLLVQGMEAGSVSERKYPLSHTQEVDPSRTE